MLVDLSILSPILWRGCPGSIRDGSWGDDRYQSCVVGIGKSSVREIPGIRGGQGPGTTSGALPAKDSNGAALLGALCLEEEESTDITRLTVDELTTTF